MPSVWPSVALATASMPSMPPAPGLFSMTTGWPQREASLSLMARTIRSSELPGPVGTTIFTGRLGQAAWAAAAWAAAGWVVTRAAEAAEAAVKARRWRRCRRMGGSRRG